MLGTGILVLPGLAASVAGPASIIAVAAVFLLSIPLAGTFAALASRYPDPGGVASYARRALGDVWARMAGYWFYFGVCVGAPVVGVLGAEYVVAVLGVDHAAVAWVGIAIFVPPFVINFFGVRVSGALQLVLTALLLVVVVGVVAMSFPQADAANFQPFLPHGIAGIGTAISLFLWAFAGWEVGTHIAGEFRNPRRVIPIATAIAVVVVGAAYLALQFVTVAVLGDAAGTSATPLVDLVADGAPGYGPSSSPSSPPSSWRGSSTPTSAPSASWARRSDATATCRAGWPRAWRMAASRAAASPSSRCSSASTTR